MVPVKQFKPKHVLDLRELRTIEALHFPVNISERTMDCLLNSSSEVNVLPYATALSPGFATFSDIRDEAMVNIKGAPSANICQTCPYALEAWKYDCHSS